MRNRIYVIGVFFIYVYIRCIYIYIYVCVCVCVCEYVHDLIYIIYLLYLLHKDHNLVSAGSLRINAKQREVKERQVRRAKKRKGIEAPRVEPHNPFPGN